MDSGLIGTVAAVRAWIDGLDAVQLFSNPYFLAGAVLFCLVALARGMLRSLVFFLAAISLALLVHYTVNGQAALGHSIPGHSLLAFGAGGLAICGVVIYFLFIRSE